MQVNAKDGQVAFLKAKKEHGNKPAHLMGVVNNLANITDLDIVGIYRVARGVPYDSIVVVMLEVQGGESLVSAIKCQRVSFVIHNFPQKCQCCSCRNEDEL